jgi:predicted transcriptional regulator
VAFLTNFEIMRKIELYHTWNNLSDDQVIAIFNKYLSEMTFKPNSRIVYDLRNLEQSTLEVLENRTGSTVYRIRQTGVVYQIIEGDYYLWDDTSEYLDANPIDELMVSYNTKPITFTALSDEEDHLWLTHHKPPKFTARWEGDFKEIEWKDEPDFNALTELTKKAEAFINHYF